MSTVTSLVLITLLGLAACADGGTGTPRAEEAPPQEDQPQSEEPFQAGVFTSPLYGYSVELPEGWSAYEAKQELYRGQLPWPGSPEVDQFLSPGEEWMLAAAQPGSGLSLGEWTKEVIAMVRPDCGGPTSTEHYELAGEPARLIAYEECVADLSLLNVAALHGDSAYQVVWGNEPGTETADRKRVEKVLSTFRFTS